MVIAKNSLLFVFWAAAFWLPTILFDFNPWVSLTLRAIACGLLAGAVLVRHVNPGVSPVLVLGVSLLAPSFVGEQSGVAGLIIAGAAILAALLAPEREFIVFSSSSMACVLSLLCLSLYWGLTLLAPFPPPEARSLATYALLIGFLLFAAHATRVVRPCLQLWGLTTSCLGYAWAVSAPFYGSDGPDIDRHGALWRQDFTYSAPNPFVIFSSQGLLGTGRVTAFASEPGTWSAEAAVGLVAALVLFRGWKRAVVAVGSALSLISAQSTGAALAGLCALGLVFAVVALRSGAKTHITVLIGLIVVIAGIVGGTSFLLGAKAEANSASLSDRGITVLGDAAPVTSQASRINLLSSMQVDGPIVLCIFAAFAILLLSPFFRTPVGFGLLFFFLMMGLFVQPIQYHIGSWFLLGLLALTRDRKASSWGDVGSHAVKSVGVVAVRFADWRK